MEIIEKYFSIPAWAKTSPPNDSENTRVLGVGNSKTTNWGRVRDIFLNWLFFGDQPSILVLSIFVCFLQKKEARKKRAWKSEAFLTHSPNQILLYT